MNHSPLARLPPELRNHIYELAFAKYTFADMDQKDEIKNALTRTCRQIRTESLGIFLSSAIYRVDVAVQGQPMYRGLPKKRCGGTIEQVTDWLLKQGPTRCKAIALIALYLKTSLIVVYSHESWATWGQIACRNLNAHGAHSVLRSQATEDNPCRYMTVLVQTYRSMGLELQQVEGLGQVSVVCK